MRKALSLLVVVVLSILSCRPVFAQAGTAALTPANSHAKQASSNQSDSTVRAANGDSLSLLSINIRDYGVEYPVILSGHSYFSNKVPLPGPQQTVTWIDNIGTHTAIWSNDSSDIGKSWWNGNSIGWNLQADSAVDERLSTVMPIVTKNGNVFFNLSGSNLHGSSGDYGTPVFFPSIRAKTRSTQHGVIDYSTVSISQPGGTPVTASSSNSSTPLQHYWGFGVGYGAALGLNESNNNAIVFQDRIEAIAFNGLTSGVSPELGLAFFALHNKDTGSPTSYQTRMIVSDLRVRISWLPSTTWFPYLDAGIGVVLYDVTNVPTAAARNAILSDATIFFPVGLGLYHRLSEHIGLDINLNLCPSMSDDINPVRDGRPDGWWGSTVSLLIVI